MTLDVVKRIAKRLVVLNEMVNSTDEEERKKTEHLFVDKDAMAGFLLIITKCKLELNNIHENIPRTAVKFIGGVKNESAVTPVLKLTERQKKLTLIWNELDLKVSYMT